MRFGARIRPKVRGLLDRERAKMRGRLSRKFAARFGIKSEKSDRMIRSKLGMLVPMLLTKVSFEIV